MTFRIALVVAVLVVITTATSAQTVSRQITGLVYDSTGAAIPGVQVTVTGPGLRVATTTITDDRGRFVIKGPLQPPPAEYTVIAQLAGFETTTVMVRASDEGVDGWFTIRLHVGCFVEFVEVIPELPWAVQAADVVAVVRPIDARIEDGRCGPITKLRATIVEVVKDRREQRTTSIQFDLLLGQQIPMTPGDTYIAFLQSDRVSGAYRVMSRFLFMPVREGQVVLPTGERKPVADVLSLLRSVSKE